MDNDNSAFEIAIIAESLCKSGDYIKGINLFIKALDIGTDDVILLDAIYNTMGNAYFYISNYEKAFQYNKYCLSLAKLTNNKASEARACGNLANTLKLLNRFEEAFACCNQHIFLSSELHDKVNENRALFNLGSIFYAMALQEIQCNNSTNNKKLSSEFNFFLEQALENYKLSLFLSQELNLSSTFGRIYGNMGCVYFMLGNYKEALIYYKKRLEIGIEQKDLEAQRRSYNNIGNSYIFLMNPEMAVCNFLKALALSEVLNDIPTQITTIFNIANTYLVLNNIFKSVEYFTLHLQICGELKKNIMVENIDIFIEGGVYAFNNQIMHSLYNLILIFKSSGLKLKTLECIEQLQNIAELNNNEFYSQKVYCILNEMNITNSNSLKECNTPDIKLKYEQQSTKQIRVISSNSNDFLNTNWDQSFASSSITRVPSLSCVNQIDSKECLELKKFKIFDFNNTNINKDSQVSRIKKISISNEFLNNLDIKKDFDQNNLSNNIKNRILNPNSFNNMDKGYLNHRINDSILQSNNIDAQKLTTNQNDYSCIINNELNIDKLDRINGSFKNLSMKFNNNFDSNIQNIKFKEIDKHNEHDTTHIFKQKKSPQLMIKNNGTKKVSRKLCIEETDLYEMISILEERRLDDQRCSSSLIASPTTHSKTNQMIQTDPTPNNLQGVLMSSQKRSLPGLVSQISNYNETLICEETFLDLIIKHQFTRFESQRSFPPSFANQNPDDLFSLIVRVQSTRIENQRYPFNNFKKSQSHLMINDSCYSHDNNSASLVQNSLESVSSYNYNNSNCLNKESYMHEISKPQKVKKFRFNFTDVFKRKMSKSISVNESN